LARGLPRDVQENPNTEHAYHQGASAVADERQGNACERYRVRDGSDVQESLENNGRSDSDGQELREAVGSFPGDLVAAIGEKHEQSNDCDCAEKSEFLGRHGEDAVGEWRGQEVLLLAVARTDAKEPTPSKSDQRLDRMISRRTRVLPGIQPDSEPRPSVRLQAYAECAQRKSDRDPRGQVIKPSPSHKVNRDHRQADDNRRSHVRLKKHKDANQSQHHTERHGAGAPLPNPGGSLPAQPVREIDGQGDLGQLTGFELVSVELKPALGPVRRGAEMRNEHRDK